jgi:hypothetical protein
MQTEMISASHSPLAFDAGLVGVGTADASIVPRRGRPAAAVVSNSLPRFDVTVAGGSGALVVPFFLGGIVAFDVVCGARPCAGLKGRRRCVG